MNKVIVTGNLVKDVLNQSTVSGTPVVSNTIAVRGNHKDESGEYETYFINFVAWKTQAEYLRKYGKKGDRLEIVGYWKVRNYTTDRGENKRVDELIVESINIYSKKDQPQEEATSYKEATKNIINDDLPF